jgi:hypothetical protein
MNNETKRLGIFFFHCTGRGYVDWCALKTKIDTNVDSTSLLLFGCYHGTWTMNGEVPHNVGQ